MNTIRDLEDYLEINQQLEMENTYQELLSDAALNIMVKWCVDYKIKHSELSYWLSMFLDQGRYKDCYINEGRIEADITTDEIEFLDKIIEISDILKRGYYVYELIDPRTESVFYVGKGTDNRICDHEIYARSKSGHCNSCVQNTIQDVNKEGLRVIYRIIDADISQEEAYKNESWLIEQYNIDNLCNERERMSCPEFNHVLNRKIESIIYNYESWYTRHINSGRNCIQDRITFLCLLLHAQKLNTLTGISISEREMAEKIGVNEKTAGKSLNRLERSGLIIRSFKGKGCIASKFSLVENKLCHFTDNGELAICSKNGTFFKCLQHDAFRHSALNNTGYMVYIFLLKTPNTSYTVKELVYRLSIPPVTVRRTLKKMVDSEILIYCDHKYSLDPEHTLDAVSDRFGTSGIGNIHKMKHYYQRKDYRRRILEWMMPRDYSGSITQYLVECLVTDFNSYKQALTGLLSPNGGSEYQEHNGLPVRSL